VSDPCSSAAIDDLAGEMHAVDPNWGLEVTTVKQAAKHCHGLLDFLDSDHCMLSEYLFCVAKCGRPECGICKADRLPASLLADLRARPSLMPLPVLPAGAEHHESYDVAKLKAADDTGRPSHAPPKKAPATRLHTDTVAKESSPQIFHARNVRAAVICQTCNKPRTIHHTADLLDDRGRATLLQLQDHIHAAEYVCGDDITAPPSLTGFDPKGAGFVMQVGITCHTIVGASYFKCPEPHGPYAPCCIHCGDTDGAKHATAAELQASKLLLANQKLVRPMCRSCAELRRKPHGGKVPTTPSSSLPLPQAEPAAAACHHLFAPQLTRTCSSRSTIGAGAGGSGTGGISPSSGSDSDSGSHSGRDFFDGCDGVSNAGGGGGLSDSDTSDDGDAGGCGGSDGGGDGGGGDPGDVFDGEGGEISLIALQRMLKSGWVLNYVFDSDCGTVLGTSDRQNTYYPRITWAGEGGARRPRIIAIKFDDGEVLDMEVGNFQPSECGHNKRWWLARADADGALPARAGASHTVRAALHGSLSLEAAAMADLFDSQKGENHQGFLTSDILDFAVCVLLPEGAQPAAGQAVAVASSTLPQMTEGDIGSQQLAHVAGHLRQLGTGPVDMLVHHMDSGQDKVYRHVGKHEAADGAENIRTALLAAGVHCGQLAMHPVSGVEDQGNDNDCGVHVAANAASSFEEITAAGSMDNWLKSGTAPDDIMRLRIELHGLVTAASEHHEAHERDSPLPKATEPQLARKKALAQSAQLAVGVAVEMELEGQARQKALVQTDAWAQQHAQHSSLPLPGEPEPADVAGGGLQPFFLLVPFNARLHWSLLVVELRPQPPPRPLAPRSPLPSPAAPPRATTGGARAASARTPTHLTPGRKKSKAGPHAL
jgi:hypothetical protein